MSTLERQIDAISTLFVQALSHTIRLVQWHAGVSARPGAMASLVHDINSEKSLQLAQLLKQQSIGASTPTLYEHWIAESLSNAHAAVKQIRPRAVRAFRWRGQKTNGIFEAHIATARDNFANSTSGVKRCINQCFSQPQQYQTEGIEELAELSNTIQKLERRLDILASRILSLVYSPRLWVVILVFILLSIPVGYYVEAVRSTGSTDGELLQHEVSAKFDKQASDITKIAKQPEKDFWTKTDEISKKIKDIVGNAKTIIAGLLAIWGLLIKRLGR